MKKALPILLIIASLLTVPVYAEEEPNILTLDNIQNGVYDGIAVEDITTYAGFESAEWGTAWTAANAIVMNDDDLVVMFTPTTDTGTGERLAVYVSPYEENIAIYADYMMGTVTQKEREGKSVTEDEYEIDGHKVVSYVYMLDGSVMKTDYCINTGSSWVDIVYQGNILAENSSNLDAVFALVESIKLPEKFE